MDTGGLFSYHSAAPTKRKKRGPSLSRRTGQQGSVFQRGGKFYGKVYVDEPTGRKRSTISLGVCRTKTIAKQKLREWIERAGINTAEVFYKNTTPPSATFRAQAEVWFEHLRTRTRRPAKPATLANYRQILDRWLLPNIGDLPISDITNSTLRDLVRKMVAAKLSPRTISDYVLPAKLVVGSVLDDNGEPVYPRKWNAEFIGLPIIDRALQRRPTVTREEFEAILTNMWPRYQVLTALLAVTGLRIGEALGLRSTDFAPDCSFVRVQRSITKYGNREQAPKTSYAHRVVDLPAEFAACVQGFVASRQNKPYLFCTRTGRPVGQRSVLRMLHKAGVKGGFHRFRRFRTEVLRRAGVPESLIGYWTGHADTTMNDLYARGLERNEQWRREWVEKAGVGFTLPLNGLHGPQKSIKNRPSESVEGVDSMVA